MMHFSQKLIKKDTSLFLGVTFPQRQSLLLRLVFYEYFQSMRASSTNDQFACLCCRRHEDTPCPRKSRKCHLRKVPVPTGNQTRHPQHGVADYPFFFSSPVGEIKPLRPIGWTFVACPVLIFASSQLITMCQVISYCHDASSPSQVQWNW